MWQNHQQDHDSAGSLHQTGYQKSLQFVLGFELHLQASVLQCKTKRWPTEVKPGIDSWKHKGFSAPAPQNESYFYDIFTYSCSLSLSHFHCLPVTQASKLPTHLSFCVACCKFGRKLLREQIKYSSHSSQLLWCPLVPKWCYSLLPCQSVHQWRLYN